RRLGRGLTESSCCDELEGGGLLDHHRDGASGGELLLTRLEGLSVLEDRHRDRVEGLPGERRRPRELELGRLRGERANRRGGFPLDEAIVRIIAASDPQERCGDRPQDLPGPPARSCPTHLYGSFQSTR